MTPKMGQKWVKNKPKMTPKMMILRGVLNRFEREIEPPNAIYVLYNAQMGKILADSKKKNTRNTFIGPFFLISFNGSSIGLVLEVAVQIYLYERF